MSSKFQYKDIPETHTGVLRHTYPSLHRLLSFLSPPPPTSSLLQGSRWGRFQSSGCAVPVFVSAACYLGVSPFSLCSVHSPGVPASGCGSVEEAGVWCVCCVPTCPTAVLTHLAFPAALPWLPSNTGLLPAGHRRAEFKYWDVPLPSSCAPHHIKISSAV